MGCMMCVCGGGEELGCKIMLFASQKPNVPSPALPLHTHTFGGNLV